MIGLGVDVQHGGDFALQGFHPLFGPADQIGGGLGPLQQCRQHDQSAENPEVVFLKLGQGEFDFCPM